MTILAKQNICCCCETRIIFFLIILLSFLTICAQVSPSPRETIPYGLGMAQNGIWALALEGSTIPHHESVRTGVQLSCVLGITFPLCTDLHFLVNIFLSFFYLRRAEIVATRFLRYQRSGMTPLDWSPKDFGNGPKPKKLGWIYD